MKPIFMIHIAFKVPFTPRDKQLRLGRSHAPYKKRMDTFLGFRSQTVPIKLITKPKIYEIGRIRTN